MHAFQSKIHPVVIIAILALFSISFTACGDSQGVTTLTAHLAEFSDLIEDYKTTAVSDKTKQAELDAKIADMSEKWTNIRNEFGSEITPQKMDDFVKQYENLMLTLASIKKTIGS